MIKKILGVCLLVVVGVMAGQAAFAEGPPPEFFGGAIPAGPQEGSELLTLLVDITDWIFVIVMIFSVIFIILAGWQFISAGGDAQAVSQARMKLLWAAIGIVVAVMSKGVPTVVRAIINF